jgi:hypothetical protein
MGHVLGYAAKIIFYLFVIVIAFWTCSLTVAFVSRVLPGDPIKPYLALAIFDGGALAWLLVFLRYSKGLGQRAVSLLMMIMDLAGVGIMAVAELFLGGQTFAEVPDGLGNIAVWSIGIWTVANLFASYAFHVFDPKSHEVITIGVAQDRVTAAGLKALESKLEVLGEELGEEIGDRLKGQTLRELGLQDRPARLQSGRRADVVDVPAPGNALAVGLPELQLARAQMSEQPELLIKRSPARYYPKRRWGG